MTRAVVDERSLGPAGPFPAGVPGGLRGGPLERQWLHYAFLSRGGDLAVIANLSVLGADGADEPPHRRGIVLVHDEGGGWEASQFNASQQDVPWSSFRLPRPRGAERFTVAAVAGSPALDVRLRGTGRACTSQCAPFGDGEFLRWQSEPGVLGSGVVTAHGRAREVELTGYHERVRGRWSWPALGGWVFGFVNAAHDAPGCAVVDAEPAPPSASVVFTLVQPRSPGDAANGSLMLWRDGRLVRHFPRRCLEVAVEGGLDRDSVVLVPPLAELLDAPVCAMVPGRLVLSARMGRDHLLVDFTSRAAARIANPCERGLRPFSVHETLGPCRVRGVVSGRPVAFDTRGIVEFAGGADEY
ncbi:hypothetical protein [Streptomyces griseus]|uniref:hypothetical protein n=1 Tax=Streptomyces griseus TaxID=1911 RepID=UPI001F37D129|nr:hypothetical protein [Streptomyces griseus]